MPVLTTDPRIRAEAHVAVPEDVDDRMSAGLALEGVSMAAYAPTVATNAGAGVVLPRVEGGKRRG